MAAEPKWQLAQACCNTGRMSFSKTIFAFRMPLTKNSKHTRVRDTGMALFVECSEN
jgi:hypothetical protein